MHKDVAHLLYDSPRVPWVEGLGLLCQFVNRFAYYLHIVYCSMETKLVRRQLFLVCPLDIVLYVVYRLKDVFQS